MTDNELKELVASLAVSQKETDTQIKELSVSQKITDKQIQETDKQIQETDKKLDRVTGLFDNISKNQGLLVEEFFYQSLIKKNCIGKLCFDDIAQNMKKHRGKIQEEYDIILTNGNSIAIIEVKQKTHINDLVALKRKTQNFKKLFPIYKDYKLYAGFATYHIYDEAKNATLDDGYFVLQRTGDFIFSESHKVLQAS